MKRIGLLLVVFLTASMAFPQRGDRWRHTWTELVLGAGPVRMYNDMDRNRWGLGFQAGTRFSIHRYWTLSTTVSYGSFHGSDPENDYAYATWGIEPAARAEFHFLTRQFRNIGYNRRQLILWEPRMTGYLFTGFGVNYFRSIPEESLVNLADKPFMKYKPVFPWGVGYKHSFSNRFSLYAETGLTFVRTDYFEAWATSEKRKFDRYLFVSAGITWKMNIKEMQSPEI